MIKKKGRINFPAIVGVVTRNEYGEFSVGHKASNGSKVRVCRDATVNQ